MNEDRDAEISVCLKHGKIICEPCAYDRGFHVGSVISRRAALEEVRPFLNRAYSEVHNLRDCNCKPASGCIRAQQEERLISALDDMRLLLASTPAPTEKETGEESEGE